MQRALTSAMILAAAAAVSAAGPVSAAPLVYEGFDYTLNDGIAGKTGGTGWGADDWDTNGNVASATIVSPMTFSDFGQVGNALEIASGNSKQQWAYVSRQLGATIPAGTLEIWVSYLIEPSTADDSAYKDGYHHGVSSGETTVADRFGTRLREYTANSSVSAVTYGADAASGASGLSLDTTYLVIGKYTDVNAGGGGGAGDFWVLDSADWDAVKDAGVTEAELDANNVTTATVNSLTAATLLNTDYFVWAMIPRYDDQAITNTVDELRMATTLTEVLPQAATAPIPEPATLVMLAAGLGGLAQMVRRRRRA